MRRAYAVCDGCDGGRYFPCADGGGKRKCVGRWMDNEDEERSVGRRKGRVSRRRGECRGNTARARKWRREPREIYDKEESKMIAITKHADKRIKERVPGMKSAEKRM